MDPMGIDVPAKFDCRRTFSYTSLPTRFMVATKRYTGLYRAPILTEWGWIFWESSITGGSFASIYLLEVPSTGLGETTQEKDECSFRFFYWSGDPHIWSWDLAFFWVNNEVWTEKLKVGWTWTPVVIPRSCECCECCECSYFEIGQIVNTVGWAANICPYWGIVGIVINPFKQYLNHGFDEIQSTKIRDWNRSGTRNWWTRHGSTNIGASLSRSALVVVKNGATLRDAEVKWGNQVTMWAVLKSMIVDVYAMYCIVLLCHVHSCTHV